MNGQQLSSTGFKSKTVGLVIHGSLFNDPHLVAKHPLKLNNTIAIKYFWIFNMSFNMP